MTANELRKHIRGHGLPGLPSRRTGWLKDLLFPVSCTSCGTPDTLVCEECLADLIKPKVKRYYRGPLRAVYGAFDYHDDLTRTLITKFKYEGVTELAAVFGRVLSVLISGEIPALPAGRSGSPVVVPVPSDFWRRLERGYNQTELVTRAVSRLTGYPVERSLKKRYPTPSQTGLDRRQRRKNIAKSFIWRGGTLTGKTVVIVDDVTTTGATIAEAARAMRAAKPKLIYGLVLAFD